LAIFLATPTFALEPQDNSANREYVVKIWGADDGLTEGSVTDVAQTPEGYLWVGTLFGSVLRFDGTRFVSYNSASTPEFSQKWGVPHFMVDPRGTLWISMYDGGMTTWDKDGFRAAFTSTNQPERLLLSTPGRVVFAYGGGRLLCGRKFSVRWEWDTINLPGALPQPQLCADADNHVWYLRGENELGIWDANKKTAVAINSGLEGQRITILTADDQGTVWLGTDNSLNRWRTGGFELMTPTNGEPTLNVKRIIPSGGTNVWVEANGRLRRCSDRRWLAESEGWVRELGQSVSLRFLHGDAEGGLWSGAGDLGLLHVLPDGRFHRLTTRDGLPSNTIHFAFQDRDGNTWTGYERGALVEIRRRMFQVIGAQEGLSDSLINTVSEDAQGGVWIGTHSGTVAHFENGVCTNLVLPGAARAQDSCAVPDSQGRLWIGAQRVGLLMCEAGQTRRVVQPTQLQGPAQSQGYPRLLLPARDGRLWLGTLWSIMSVDNNQVSTAFTAATVGEHPTALAETADGTIWAGTLAGYLLRSDGGRFLPLEPPDRSSLGRIWTLWPAPDKTLWAGTEEGGLLHWKNGKFFRFTMKDGLPSDSISQVVGDAQGNLWLGTRAGIVRVFGPALAKLERGEINELPISLYGQLDGLLTIGSAIIFQPNCWRGKGNTLFFAMANSIAIVNSDKVHINRVAPTVALEGLRVDDKQVWPVQVGAVLTPGESVSDEDHLASIPRLTVGPGRGDLEFRYTGLSLSSGPRVRFKYRLEGLETDWNSAGGERTAIYRRLAPGDYVFHVRACNSDSIWNHQTALVAVTVKPFIYQTAWFKGGLGFLLVAGSSWALVAAARRRMQRRLEQLERKHELEHERSRIAQDLHDDLGAGLTEIGLLGGLLQRPSDFTEHNPQALERIVQRCREMVTALDEIVWAVNPRNDSVNSIGGYLCKYAQSFFEPTSIRCRLEAPEMDSPHACDSEQRHHLFLAFKEALTNVVRHSGATEVAIRIAMQDDHVLAISIEDNGHGLPQSVGSDSDGLLNLRQRMARIGGKCDVTSRPTGGVAVRLSLPISRDLVSA
jgi:signal transduction histidine kinase/ligand-binding sensor domain-containing protein